MNTPVFTRARRFSNIAFAATVAFAWLAPAHAEWKLDFSRRAKSSRDADLKAAGTTRTPASEGIAPDQPVEGRSLIDTLFDTGEAVQDLVVLHTERGFVPSTLRVRKNGRYRVHIVNVNEKEKNVSFILDGFSEHHATYYGKIKTFNLEPRKEGTYAFQSPETSAEGKLVVFNPQITIRNPASSEETK